jgi:hypothetical protein
MRDIPKTSKAQLRRAYNNHGVIEEEQKKGYSHFTAEDVKKAAGYVPRFYASPDLNKEKMKP